MQMTSVHEVRRKMSEETPRPIMLYVENGMFMGKEMVFCKDCIYYQETHDNDHQGNHSVIMECYYDQWHPQYRDADDFCSKGERK